jgi:CspA family cold shock protein
MRYSYFALDLGQPAFSKRYRPSTRAGHLGNIPSRQINYQSIRLKERFAMAPMNGTIKRLVSDKGFGFILASDGNEYFFHNSACADTRFDDLREGQAVTFEKGQGPKGPRGENVRVA